ncbi:protein SPA1-RELATED 2-like isoform X2 [Tasmannia lanceolata]|uniref:protein SPA1-RELATED 2-like isoform X2 n=1 Tax=Tasmannia lanceolata TaxID=3420 RepID=UPI004064B75A
MEETGDVSGNVENSVGAPHLKMKESDCSLQPDSCNVLESSSMLISPGNDWHEQQSSLRSPEDFTETLEGRILMGCTSPKDGFERPQSSPCTINDGGLMVEELTFKNYKTSNFSTTGCSNSREEILPRKGQWQHLFQLAGRSRNEDSFGNVMSKEPTMSGGGEDMGNVILPKSLVSKPLPSKHLDEDRGEISNHLINSGNCTVSSNTYMRLPRGARTKVLPTSGFPQFFIKNRLKGKGAANRHSATHEGSDGVSWSQNNEKGNYNTGIASDTPQGSSVKANDLSLCSGAVASAGSFNDGISLREWLKPGFRKVNKIESLRIFKQILDLVDLSHSQGVALQDIRPSSFMVLSSEKVKYVGPWDPQIQTEMPQSVMNEEAHHLEHHTTRKRYLEHGINPPTISSLKHQKLNEHMQFSGQHFGFSAKCSSKYETVKDDNSNRFKAQNFGCDFMKQHNMVKGPKARNMSGSPSVYNPLNQQMSSESMQLEERWYTSPEELNGRLFCCFETLEAHAGAMFDLGHRIFPPKFLSEHPKAAGFCLLLLHPEPSFRPKTREILQSELILEAQNLSFGDQLSISVDEEDAESELLLHFLESLKEQKQKEASRLVENLGCLNSDIEEVEKRHSLRTESLSKRNKGFNNISDEYLRKDPLHSEVVSRPSMSRMNEARLMRNINQLENAYFSMRSKIQLPESDPTPRSDKTVLKNQDRLSPIQNDVEECSTDRLGSFFDGICKYARCSKFEVRGTLRNGDLLNSANVICSLSFDRDEDYFAAAGVSKKIKIFEFGSLLNDTVNIHYPVIEMSNKSKLSCVCWNSYIKNYLASTDYDGVVQLWDASTGQGFSQYIEHQKRAWSVDFSQVDPTKLASGSDDCSVKLWSINEENCINTIRNVANVCCVQFSPHSSHLLAFGTADYKIYCYDLRHTRVPWCTLVGHGKAVSYVKFLDADTLVSASTDNTLKLWDLNKTTSSGLSTTACSSTLSGHTNLQNFVGLSVSDGYIACGSETNEVYSYYRSLPMPITSHKFGSIDPISGQETGDDNGQFVSSVCWRGKSNTVVAANSTGSIKLLQMV